jgi:trimeric autotransporter adhesin
MNWRLCCRSRCAPTSPALSGGAQIVGVQQQVNQIDRKLRDGVARAMASGGVPSVPTGRKVGVFGNIAGYDGHGAAGFGITGCCMTPKPIRFRPMVRSASALTQGSWVDAGGVSIFW